MVLPVQRHSARRFCPGGRRGAPAHLPQSSAHSDASRIPLIEVHGTGPAAQSRRTWEASGSLKRVRAPAAALTPIPARTRLRELTPPEVRDGVTFTLGV